MSKTYEVVPADSVATRKRKSPMHVIMESVEGDYWSMAKVAQHIGVHIETIRRVCKKTNEDGTKLVKAPTDAVRAGEAVVYLFTMTDVVEIEDHFASRGYVLKNRVDPTKLLSEQDQDPKAA